MFTTHLQMVCIPPTKMVIIEMVYYCLNHIKQRVRSADEVIGMSSHVYLDCFWLPRLNPHLGVSENG